MAEVLESGKLRQRIDALELLADVQSAIADVEGVEWAPGEVQTFKLHVIDSSNKYVTYVANVPAQALLAALRHIQQVAA
jgi:hypothetical protein